MPSRGPIFARGYANTGHTLAVRRWANGDCSYYSHGLGGANRSNLMYNLDLDRSLPNGNVVLYHNRNRNLVHRCDPNPAEPLVRNLLRHLASRLAHSCPQASSRSAGILPDCAYARNGSAGSRVAGLDERIRGFSARQPLLLSF